MESNWIDSAVWFGLSLFAALVATQIAVPVALVEILVGAIVGNLVSLPVHDWVRYFATLGAVLLILIAGAEVDPAALRRHLMPSLGLGAASFLAPYLAVLLFCRLAVGWSWLEAQIAGIAMSTTSIAVVYALAVETGLTRFALGQVLLSACFLTNCFAMLALGVAFVTPNAWLIAFALVVALLLWQGPNLASRLFSPPARKISEPEVRFVFFVVFAIAAVSALAGLQAILPSFLVGLAFAPYLLRRPSVARRLRTIAFATFTPVFFLSAGALFDARAVAGAITLAGAVLVVRIAAKMVGVLPTALVLRYGMRVSTFTALVLSTGLTFDLVILLFGLDHGVIDRDKYSLLVAAVIASAVLPTLAAQRWFRPTVADSQ